MECLLSKYYTFNVSINTIKRDSCRHLATDGDCSRNHIAVDNGLERIMYSKARMDYMPNIYIIGQNGFCNFCQVFRTMSYEMLEKL